MSKDLFWTDEKCDRLRALWAEGLPLVVIAEALHAASKSAIAGKAKRLKLPPHPAAKIFVPGDRIKRAGKPVVVRRAPVKAVKPLAKPLVLESMTEANAPLPESRLLALFDLCQNTCRWPLGDVGSASFAFCGAPCDPSKPYCEGHRRLSIGQGTLGERQAHNLKSAA